MPTGVFVRTVEYRGKLSKAMVASKTRYKFPKGHIPWNKGLSASSSEKVRDTLNKGLAKYARSDEGRTKARESLGRTSRNFWANMSNEERQAFIGRRALRIKASRSLPEAVEKQRLSMVRKHKACPEWGQKTSQMLRQKHKDPEYKQRILGRLHQGRDESWADPVRKEERIRQMLGASWRRPTYLEQKVIDAIEKFNLPYKYVGDGAFILGGKNPDFMNINGEKILLEVFGEYWHDRNSTEAEDRQQFFVQYGFRTLILWGTDLKPMSYEEIAQAIDEFQ